MVTNQIILSELGNSWLGRHSFSKKLETTLLSTLKTGNRALAYVVSENGEVIEQSENKTSLKDKIKNDDNSYLVHFGPLFI